ncbi:hypothetical protein J19TS2_25960 [Cohnella xylanilytica]|uniref:hypothetical protein n=1 Tax=Cohnella xylanilytica TaxID=557555 RepID=UPI001B1B0174|nr:hypothetical protein [Cohnella xylanilytica]GIO13041.1 hypothetical protein J19TS2_25960 [Cohnella xylanilytica]
MAQIFIPGTANPNDVVAPATFSAGVYYQANGKIIDRPHGQYANKVIPWDNGSNRILAVRIPMGAYRQEWGDPGETEVEVPADTLRPENILSGKSILGVPGSVVPRRYASGTAWSASSSTRAFSTATGGTANLYYIQVSGLGFNPKYITLTGNGSSGSIFTNYYWGSFGFGSSSDNTTEWFTIAQYSTFTSSSVTSYKIKNNDLITNGGFIMPVATTSSTYADYFSWRAYTDE